MFKRLKRWMGLPDMGASDRDGMLSPAAGARNSFMRLTHLSLEGMKRLAAAQELSIQLQREGVPAPQAWNAAVVASGFARDLEAVKAARPAPAAPVAVATLYGGPMDGEPVPEKWLVLDAIVFEKGDVFHVYARTDGRYRFERTVTADEL